MATNAFNKLFNKLQKFLVKRDKRHLSVKLNSSKIYILPTKYGLLFAAVLIVMLLMAINFSNSLIYLLTFLLASISISSMFFTQKNLLSLIVHSANAKPVFCGQTAHIPIKVFAPEKQHYAINIKGDEFNQTIDADEKVEPIFFPIKTTKRGYIELPPLVVSSIFPFGLFYTWANVKLENYSLVYPKPIKHQLQKQDLKSESNEEGETASGQSDFSGLKNYQLGESLRQVHWKTYAKGLGMFSKQYAGSNHHKYWLNWDDYGQFDIEKRLSILCYLVLEAEKNGDNYGLKLPSKQVNINQGQAHLKACLKELALYNRHDNG